LSFPPCSSSPRRDLGALCLRHGFKAALPADLTALSSGLQSTSQAGLGHADVCPCRSHIHNATGGDAKSETVDIQTDPLPLFHRKSKLTLYNGVFPIHDACAHLPNARSKLGYGMVFEAARLASGFLSKFVSREATPCMKRTIQNTLPNGNCISSRSRSSTNTPCVCGARSAAKSGRRSSARSADCRAVTGVVRTAATFTRQRAVLAPLLQIAYSKLEDVVWRGRPPSLPEVWATVEQTPWRRSSSRSFRRSHYESLAGCSNPSHAARSNIPPSDAHPSASQRLYGMAQEEGWIARRGDAPGQDREDAGVDLA